MTRPHTLLWLALLGMVPALGQNPAPPAATPAPIATVVDTAAAVPVTPPATNSVSTNAVVAPGDKIDAEARELKAGDVMRFNVAQDPAQEKVLIQLVDITPAGEALFPVTRISDRYVKVLARGKRLADLRKEVKELLDAEFYHDAAITIDLEGIRQDAATAATAENSAKVTVMGVTGGSILIREGETKTLTDLVLQLGPMPRANLKKVKIRRLDPATKREAIHEYNVRELLDKGDRRNDPLLQDGDRVEIPERVLNF